MEIETKRELREFAARLRSLLEQQCAALGIRDSSDQAWYWAMYFAMRESMEARGIAGDLPGFLAIAQFGKVSFSHSLLPQCQGLMNEGKVNFSAPDALAWFHQYWYDTERQAIAARLGQDTKIDSTEVVPATQVYTEGYMADYLVQNSLGALWMSTRPESSLAADWRYYVQGENRTLKLPVRPASALSVLDPACGSGNLLLVSFDLLYTMYEEEGEKDPEKICSEILNSNLYGLDIDSRAVEVTRAVLWLRAKEKAPGITADRLTGLGEHILYTYIDGVQADLGSLLQLPSNADGQPTFSTLLNRTYDVVVTNPPYLDKRDYSRLVRDYLREHYAAGAGNLYTAFLLRCLELAEHFVGMVTPQTFLYIRHYTKLRRAIFQESYIHTLAHLGLGAFADVVVDVALFVLVKRTAGQSDLGVYFKLLGALDKQTALLEAIAGFNSGAPSGEVFVRSLSIATSLEGAPVIYWLGEKTLSILKSARPLGDVADVVLGMKTSDNRRFVRYWWELPSKSASAGWVPYEKEASGYRYQRNAAHYVRWTQGAQDFYKQYYSAQLPNARYWFRPGIVYGLISSKAFTAKLLPAGHMSDMAASCIYPREEELTFYILALLNSKIYQWLLKCFNPTVNYQPVDVKRLPVPEISASQVIALGRLAQTAAAAAGALRETEIIDRAYHYEPHSVLPLSQKLPLRLHEIWRRCLEYLLAVEAVDECLTRIFNLPEAEYRALIREMGHPVSTFPALKDYSEFPDPISEALRYIPETQLDIGAEELAEIKARLKGLYSQGPLPGQLPEVFFEELIVKLGLHPVTIFNLLMEGIRSEGWNCKLEKRLIENFFSAAVLTAIGHRWPGQDRAGAGGEEPQGILAVGPECPGPNVLEVLRESFTTEGINIVNAERDFAEYVGVDLRNWLANSFFKRHVVQFKKRPVVWHIGGSGRSTEVKGYFVHCHSADKSAELFVELKKANYRIDPELGVRINIAPVQAMGILAADVLSDAELKQALEIYQEWLSGKRDYLL